MHNSPNLGFAIYKKNIYKIYKRYIKKKERDMKFSLICETKGIGKPTKKKSWC